MVVYLAEIFNIHVFVLQLYIFYNQNISLPKIEILGREFRFWICIAGVLKRLGLIQGFLSSCVS
jgi:hypothetical protein